MKNLLYIFVFTGSLLLISCTNVQEQGIKKAKYTVSKEEAKLWVAANRLFKPISIPKNTDTANKAMVKLGKMLYFEKKLSKNSNISCNSCHNVSTFGVDNNPTSTGDDGRKGGRNSPTSFNAFMHIAQFWDGRAPDVEAQAKGPILNPIEMGMPSADYVIDRLSNIPVYPILFKNAFQASAKPMTYDNLAIAIGAYERTFITPSRFDKFLENDFEALKTDEKKGLKLFIEIGCATCHNGVAVGGNSYRVFGEKNPYPPLTRSTKIDMGVYELTKSEADKYKFKVPSLRNVAKTYPYFHDGSVQNIEDAVQIMAKTQLDKDLSAEDTKLIVSFLQTLTGELPKDAKPTL
ncbi:MAG: cytochrome-c peroxidase [Cytophagales bacterium]|nr:cytochrome-c peroxidase [Cytophagales bacterium]